MTVLITPMGSAEGRETPGTMGNKPFPRSFLWMENIGKKISRIVFVKNYLDQNVLFCVRGMIPPLLLRVVCGARHHLQEGNIQGLEGQYA